MQRLATRAPEVAFLGRLLLFGAVAFACVRALFVVCFWDRLAGLAAEDLVRAFAAGAWRDVTFLAWLLLPVWLLLYAPRASAAGRTRLRRALQVWIGCITFLLLIGVTSDFAHFSEFGVRLNGSSIDYLRQPVHLLTVLHHEFFLVPVVLLLVGTAWYTARRARRHLPDVRDAAVGMRRTAAAVSGSVLVSLVLGGAVPAWAGSHPEVEPSATFIPHSYIANQLALNGPSAFASAFLEELQPDAAPIARLASFPDVAAGAAVRAAVTTDTETRLPETRHPLGRRSIGRAPRTGRNVVVIVMESLHARGVRSLGGEHDDAPRFDELARDGVLFTDFHAVGTRTNRGLAGILASLPSLPGQSPVCALRPGDRMETLAGVLRRAEYRSVAVYGGDGQYDNLKQFAVGSGFDRLVALADFKSPRLVTDWGVCDEDMFDRALAEFGALADDGDPFFGFALTLSNHRPYLVPPGRVDEGDPEDPRRAERVAFRYADHALGAFMDAAREEPWFDHTVFVIVADHGRDARGGVAPDAENFRVPLLLYAPLILPPRRVDALCSQIDVLPTVLGLVGGDHTHCSFGRDLLAGPSPDRAMMCIGDVLLWRERDLLAVWPAQGPVETFVLDRNGVFSPLPPGSRGDEAERLEHRLRTTTRLVWDVSRGSRHHTGAELPPSGGTPPDSPGNSSRGER